MSVIAITHHDENIYNITKQRAHFYKKIPKHVSKFHSQVKYESSTANCKKPHSTMGLANEPKPDPTQFLKKFTWKGPSTRLCGEVDPDFGKHRCLKDQRLPDIPNRIALLEEEKNNPPVKQKNFIAKNVKKVLSLKPKQPEQKVVLEHHGESKPLSAGLEPHYINLKLYGKTPPYLTRIIRIQEKNIQRRKEASGTEQPICRYITREEREILLEGLKQNWEELQKQYQGLPILTDTIPKIHRKSKMEADLKQLEKDIVLVERHPYVYVYDDEEPKNT